MIHHNVFLGLGSNLGNRVRYLKRGLEHVARLLNTEMVRCSSIYGTEPVGLRDQPTFMNLVANFATDLAPLELLSRIQQIEERFGRQRKQRGGPRTLDIDLLYWGHEEIALPELQIPHPRIEERGFVLVPLNEIAPSFEAPPSFRTVARLLKNLSDQSSVRLSMPSDEFETT